MQREEGLEKLVLSINECNKWNASILLERMLSLVSKYLIFNCMAVLCLEMGEEVEGKRETKDKRIKSENNTKI